MLWLRFKHHAESRREPLNRSIYVIVSFHSDFISSRHCTDTRNEIGGGGGVMVSIRRKDSTVGPIVLRNTNRTNVTI